ncbi:MAG: addiction module toxin RelE [Nitrospirae bacterium RBG_16_64_22]|nr:MAG: addiction module toxin RelE [Nitrospirae bacterium RBG_16_64_22]
MAWRIEFAPQTEKDFRRIDHSDRQRILHFLRERVSPLDDPRSLGEPLHGPDLGRFWKYRVGRYRVICDIQEEHIVILVVRVGHRKDIYR